jgi:hypothetical protein
VTDEKFPLAKDWLTNEVVDVWDDVGLFMVDWIEEAEYDEFVGEPVDERLFTPRLEL